MGCHHSMVLTGDVGKQLKRHIQLDEIASAGRHGRYFLKHVRSTRTSRRGIVRRNGEVRVHLSGWIVTLVERA